MANRGPSKYSLAVGPCPICNSINHWLNNIPLTAYCWGTEDNPHTEWSKVVPLPFNPSLEGYDPKN